MATVLLIPHTVSHGLGIVGEVWEERPALNEPAQRIWRSPVVRNDRAQAKRDADEALSNIAYQRRHQLEMWQEHGIGEDPYLAGAEVRS